MARALRVRLSVASNSSDILSMSMPQRIQRKRTKGWKMPANTVSVTRPGRWGNPYAITARYSAADAVASVRRMVEGRMGSITEATVRAELRGKNMACWCKPGAPCHADVLLEVANRSRQTGRF